MQEKKVLSYCKDILNNKPSEWLDITTHRLDIYDESQAKTQFLEQFEALYKANDSSTSSLQALPTAYDYIRLGHPLSCVLEWSIAKLSGISPEQVISFSSQSIATLAILRKNHLSQKNTRILYRGVAPSFLTSEILKTVYQYQYELHKLENEKELSPFDGSTICISEHSEIKVKDLHPAIDFYVTLHEGLGSILIANTSKDYISEIQHVRRRETIAMTPENCVIALTSLIHQSKIEIKKRDISVYKSQVINALHSITNANTPALVASSGLSMQYAIMMGLIHDANENHTGKSIKFIVPTNCYGGTNDQARRVAACIANVTVVDLAVDGDNEMVASIDSVLQNIAKEDAVPYIIAEIPTNPRVEVPDLEALRVTLSKERKTESGNIAVAPIFILDQTFCPNVHFLGDNDMLSSVSAIAYASGSKFPSGGKCTAGYCVTNRKGASLMAPIALHLDLCDNEATALQYEILANQLLSMNQRIKNAYVNTRDFVTFIQEVLPKAKINFVSEALADQGFTPSVFSLDLATKGNTNQERETYKRALNLKLINLMITEIPNESKYCVSYGQLKGCYWTIPATSTQGTTKEGDKDYIVRASLSGSIDLEKHKEVFKKFVEAI